MAMKIHSFKIGGKVVFKPEFVTFHGMDGGSCACHRLKHYNENEGWL